MSPCTQNLSRGRIAAIALALLIGCGSVPAHAGDFSGECKHKGVATQFSDGIAFKDSNPFTKGQIDTVVMLSSFTLDKAPLASSTQKALAVSSQRSAAKDGRTLRLRIHGDKVLDADYNAVSGKAWVSGSALGEFKPGPAADSQIAARFALDDSSEGLRCDLRFNVAFVDAAKPAAAGATTAAASGGKPLPPGGGEAGKVFQDNLAAMRKGDVDAMLATVVKSQADKMRAQRKDPKFGAMVEMMKRFAPRSATVTGGRDFGDRVELDIDAVDQSGAKSAGVSRLVKEDGQWKVEKTSMKSGG
jgi:hypothetical protein